MLSYDQEPAGCSRGFQAGADKEPWECSRGNQAGADFQIGSPLCLIGLLEPSGVMGVISASKIGKPTPQGRIYSRPVSGIPLRRTVFTGGR